MTDKGKIVGIGDMEAQMRQAYTNIQKLLAQYGATMDNIVDEILFVKGMDAAFAAAVKCRENIFSAPPLYQALLCKFSVLCFLSF
jgi:2-iminobutanoate/2-iminopropanoate deaminase